MKQQTFKKANYWGSLRKCVLTIWGRNDYSVAYFMNADALKADAGARDFKSRKEAMYSIECHLDLA